MAGNDFGIDIATTRSIATLARVELSESELKTFTSQLRDVVNYINQLAELDSKIKSESVEPLFHPLDLTSSLREDIPMPSPKGSDGRPKILESAPEVLNDGFKVPSIL